MSWIIKAYKEEVEKWGKYRAESEVTKVVPIDWIWKNVKEKFDLKFFYASQSTFTIGTKNEVNLEEVKNDILTLLQKYGISKESFAYDPKEKTLIISLGENKIKLTSGSIIISHERKASQDEISLLDEIAEKVYGIRKKNSL